jgi:phosphoglycolate phosphatase
VKPALSVFDLDGTLVDSSRDLAESANELLLAYGAPPLADRRIVRMIGSGAAALVSRVLLAASVDVPVAEALPRFLDLYNQRLTRHTRPYDGIPQVLHELREARVEIALLTNKPLDPSVKILDAFDLAPYFRWIVGGDGPWPRKPAPDSLHHIMQQAGIGAADTVLIGDSAIDLQTARNAGVRICLARYGFGYDDLDVTGLRGDEAIVDSAAAIADVLLVRG